MDTDSANYNQVKTGTSVVTHSYALPCKMVIHTVGPVYDEYSYDTCCDQLKQAVKSILQVIDDFNLQTICVPAISTGVYKFPIQKCAEIFTEELYQFSQERVSQGKTITIIDIKDDTLEAFKAAFIHRIQNKQPF